MFSFSKTSCHTKVRESSLPDYLSMAGGRIVGFIPFTRVLLLCEMQTTIVQNLKLVCCVCIYIYIYSLSLSLSPPYTHLQSNNSFSIVCYKVSSLLALFIIVQSNIKKWIPRLNHFHIQINKRHLRKAGGYIGCNIVLKLTTIKMRIIVRKIAQKILHIKPHLKNSDRSFGIVDYKITIL